MLTSNTPKQVEMTEIISVDSTNLVRVGYNTRTAEMGVEFSSGSTVIYQDVPINVFQGFLTAFSAGGYYNREVRGQYRGLPTDNYVMVEVKAPDNTSDYVIQYEISGTLEAVIREKSMEDALRIFNDDIGAEADKISGLTIKVKAVTVNFED